jgi:hypothetical protein
MPGPVKEQASWEMTSRDRCRIQRRDLKAVKHRGRHNLRTIQRPRKEKETKLLQSLRGVTFHCATIRIPEAMKIAIPKALNTGA